MNRVNFYIDKGHLPLSSGDVLDNLERNIADRSELPAEGWLRVAGPCIKERGAALGHYEIANFGGGEMVDVPLVIDKLPQFASEKYRKPTGNGEWPVVFSGWIALDGLAHYVKGHHIRSGFSYGLLTVPAEGKVLDEGYTLLEHVKHKALDGAKNKRMNRPNALRPVKHRTWN